MPGHVVMGGLEGDGCHGARATPTNTTCGRRLRVARVQHGRKLRSGARVEVTTVQ